MADELDELRKKRLQKLKEQLSSEEGSVDQEQAAQEEMEKRKKSILRQIMTSEARERLARIKIARKQFGEQIENQLIALAQTGRIKKKIDDKQFRKLLSEILPDKRERKIRRR